LATSLSSHQTIDLNLADKVPEAEVLARFKVGELGIAEYPVLGLCLSE
jgi:hypothetical protein